MHNLHTKIIIEPNFIPDNVCDFIISHAKSQDLKDLQVFDSIKTNELGSTQWKTDKAIRDTQTVDNSQIKPLLETIIRRAVFDIINPFYNITIDSSEAPQILRYGVGGHYKEHIDAESMFVNKGKIEWKQNVARDVSFIFYLNDSYEGGELNLPNQNILLKPKKGMFVAFPSYHKFLHGVLPVTSGERFAIVTWATILNKA